MTLLEYSTTGLAVKYGDVQLAVFDLPKRVLCDMTDVCFSSSLYVGFVHNLFLDSCPHR